MMTGAIVAGIWVRGALSWAIRALYALLLSRELQIHTSTQALVVDSKNFDSYPIQDTSMDGKTTLFSLKGRAAGPTWGFKGPRGPVSRFHPYEKE